MALSRVLADIVQERVCQDAKYGTQNHPDFIPGFQPKYREFVRDHATEDCERANPRTWEHILQEEVLEALACGSDLVHLRRELIQVSAVCVAWVEAIDRRNRLVPAA